MSERDFMGRHPTPAYPGSQEIYAVNAETVKGVDAKRPAFLRVSGSFGFSDN
jgi:hypothetical protein